MKEAAKESGEKIKLVFPVGVTTVDGESSTIEDKKGLKVLLKDCFGGMSCNSNDETEDEDEITGE